MNHQDYKELAHLSVYGELDTGEQQALSEHLASCAECRGELEDLRKLQTMLGRSRGVRVSDDVLQEARMELRVALRLERSKVSPLDRITRRIDELLAPWAKLAAGSAMLLAVGFLSGYLVFRSSAAGSGGLMVQKVSEGTTVSRGESQVANLKFIDSDPGDGELEFTFDAVSPVHVKGSVNDPGVQSVLTRALVEEQNPGIRLRAVSAITSQVQIETAVDPAVKKSLIDAMKFDENPGVRQQALKALRKFPFDDDIRDGLLYVLTKDKNQGMRVEAINSFMEAKDSIKSSSDDKLLDILRKKMESEDNKFVRRGVRAVLEEVQQ